MPPFHVCPVCKCPGFRHFSLCCECAVRLRRHIQITERKTETYVSQSLFAWGRSSPRALSELVYSLKGREDTDAWTELAAWLLSQVKPPAGAVYVPVPGRRPNHALGFAKALARLTGRPLVESLVQVHERRQKRLDRAHREGMRFHLRAGHLCTDYRTVLLIDDVITTGATARAAFTALGRPNSFTVWCLLDRRPCGADGSWL